MSEETNTTESVMVGFRKLAAQYVPVVVGAVNAAVVGVNLPLPKDYEPVSLVTWLVQAVVCMSPTIASVITSVKYMAENVKQDAVHTEATAKVEAAKVTPAPTVMITNPDYGKYQSPQIVDGKFVEKNEPQIKADFPNLASQQIEAMDKLTATDEGAFQILINNIGETIDREFQHWVTASLQPIEALQKVVAHYLDVNLTPADCEAIIANKNLASILHSYADKTIIASIYTAHKAGTLGKGVWEGCMARAKFYARKSILDNLQKKLNGEDITLAREAMSALGLNTYTQKTAVSSGGTWMVNIGGSYRYITPAELAGIDPLTMLNL